MLSILKRKNSSNKIDKTKKGGGSKGNGITISEDTAAEYRKIAERFYRQKLAEGEKPSPAAIRRALIKMQSDYRPNTWRKFRIAIAFDQQEKGFKKSAEKIRALTNSVTANAVKTNDYSKVKKKERRVKNIDQRDVDKIESALKKKGDLDLFAAFVLAKETGCRPSEMGRVTVKKGEVWIVGAKVSHEEGKEKGLPIRKLSVAPEKLKRVSGAANQLRGIDPNSDYLARRLERLTKKIFPRRANRPTFYTFRHMMGSELKASGMSRQEQAYCMGHRVTASIDTYGDRRYGRRSASVVKPSRSADVSLVRENHTRPPVHMDRMFGADRASEGDPMTIESMENRVLAAQEEASQALVDMGIEETARPQPDRDADDNEPSMGM